MQGRKMYRGEFKDGEFHGNGTVYLQNGDSYKGKWERGQLQEQGVYTWENGERARFTYIEDSFTFQDNRIVFPENDFRLEYRGGLK